MCRIPPVLIATPVSRPADEPVRQVPVRGYLLALSWSPQYCRTHRNDAQCDPSTGRFGFILHGLWPEGAGRDYPQWCAAAPPLDPAVVRAQFCATPSARLIAHEWAKHGTCATRDPAQYFSAARKLFGAVRVPDMVALSRRRIDVGGFKRAFAATNRRIPPSALIVSNDRQGGWLREVRICLSRALMPEPCPRGKGGGAPDRSPLRIWRG